MANGRKPLPGFRLRRLEMFNWGTFNQKVAVIVPDGRWTLLVGENGSGKSTAVDALRTLLVPPRLLNYNDASGDQKRRDRSRRSYVRGAWATSSQEDSAAARVEYLRKPGEQTILLAVFANEHTGAAATLAQVLWETNDKVDEKFAVARGDKSIAKHLSALGKTSELKKALRAGGFESYDSFAGYEESFRSRLGIPTKGALEVFNQAIGVKEVGDVNQFIRRHMLEPSDAVDFITNRLRPHYKELDACWQAILKAKAQIAKLEVIAASHHRIEEARARKAELETLQQAAPLYYAWRHLDLRAKESARLERELSELAQKRTALESAQAADTEQRSALELDLANDTVGLRIKAIELEHSAAMTRKRDKEARHQTIKKALATIQKPVSFDSPETFQAMRAQTTSSKGLFEGNRASARQKQLEAEIEQRDALKQRADAADELESLRRNRVLIPREFVALRLAVSEATGIAPEELPFAGELMEVKPEFRQWTGAIERLLRSFGISMLVPEKHYLPVTQFINAQHLGLRLTYHRVPPQASMARAETAGSSERVPARLNYRDDHPLHSWVRAEVSRRFNHVCCPDVQRLKDEDYGITREGLIRSGPTQHIKDDRKLVNDIASYVLGWSTESKIRALTQVFEAAEKSATDAGKRAAAAGQQVKDLDARIAAVETVLGVAEFAEVDFRSEQVTLERLHQEKEELEASSDRRKTLKKQLEALKKRIEERQAELMAVAARNGGLESHRADNAAETQKLSAFLKPHEPCDFSVSGELLAEAQEERTLTLQNIREAEAGVGRKLQARVNQQNAALSKASDEMLPRMAEFLRDYPEETADKRAEPEYAAEFVHLQERLRKEDLPKHELEFEKFLSLNLIGDMAMFSTKLGEHEKEIKARVEVVNRALKGIPFAADTHVQIVARSKGAGDETAVFRAELRACLAGGLNPAPDDRVRIFGLIRELIAKFDRDENWTRRVTDARNWLEFGVRELADADKREINYYAASSGKSGGQKTKLAFTILASAITAQYGLVGAGNESETFRLVVIDEVFARTDETNSERALKLFQSLGLQLVIVSPFDAKSRIVEDYVDSFHLCVNPESNNSLIRAASRVEYDTARQNPEPAADHAQP